MKKWFVLAACLVISWEVQAQQDGAWARMDKDGILYFSLSEHIVYGKAPSAAEKKAFLDKLKKYEKLRRNVILVYPLAKKCGRLLNEVNAELAGLDKNADRSKYLKRLEKQLFSEHEKQIRNMTLSQGKILIKLIHRETNESAFQLLEEYKNWSGATFWQVIAKICGADLKAKYNKEEERVIELIIAQIESGKADGYVVHQ